jgi:hypothetical protein
VDSSTHQAVPWLFALPHRAPFTSPSGNSLPDYSPPLPMKMSRPDSNCRRNGEPKLASTAFLQRLDFSGQRGFKFLSVTLTAQP